jgi:molybdenum cofactor biosynthesis enzyme MoaA
MRIQTFSIVAGSEACNARCPFCVSKMTVSHSLGLKEPQVNWRNFRKACQLAARSGVTTAMLTGKGEPTLFPEQISAYLRAMRPFDFPLVELQTNGILLVEQPDHYRAHLETWSESGLSLVAVSIMHHEPERNREIYLPHRSAYIDLAALIDTVHACGLSIRLACVMAAGYVDTIDELDELVRFAREHRVEQLTVRPVAHPGADRSRDAEVYDWSAAHYLPEERQREIHAHLERQGVRLMTLMHGAQVFDVGGQNVCLTDCLTIAPATEDIRQLIFFPDGHLRYDWQYEGAILL